MVANADRLRGLSRHRWREDSLSLDAGAAQRTIHNSGERREAERSGRRCEVCEASGGRAERGSEINPMFYLNFPERIAITRCRPTSSTQAVGGLVFRSSSVNRRFGDDGIGFNFHFDFGPFFELHSLPVRVG